MICQSLTNLSEMVAREVQAEEQMNSGEELLNRAIDTYWDACVYLDAKQDTWRINYVNEAFVTLTGLPQTQNSNSSSRPKCTGQEAQCSVIFHSIISSVIH